ncbi:MAG TPA: hypothetical protein VKQ11_22005 [Candidatus Sulfotelmatobacter sp.]|nr:hypothetical protein [Candidatus Sulfotelmatobacter sp.]
MKISALILVIFLGGLNACNKSSAPAASSRSTSPKSADAVELKLQEYAGGGSATDCGRLDVHASQDQSKTASDCALQASQGKHPFYVAYDMPGMTVGVAGNSDGKLFTVQAQGSPSPSVTAGACPSQLRVASSGRVTCFAPGDMGGMGGSHAAGAVPPGMANPHGSSVKPPSN